MLFLFPFTIAFFLEFVRAIPLCFTNTERETSTALELIIRIRKALKECTLNLPIEDFVRFLFIALCDSLRNPKQLFPSE